jgi:Zn-dependent peptidase ImmA (M78 family)/DNA-binding XRE family transcriptional regulator
MFSGARLEVARERRGLTKSALAAKVGVEARTVTGWEKNEYPPTEPNVTAICKALDYPPAFFAAGDIERASAEAVSFRSMSKMKAAQRDATIAACSISFLLDDWLHQRFNLPKADLPDLREDTPHAAAATLREQWGVGEKPVKNMVHLLESRGIRVFSLSQNCVEVDACSLWRQDRPYVYLNTFKSAERSRYDAAHELGHLVLHKHAAPNGIRAEWMANQFAAAFLMPPNAVRASAPKVTTLANLVQLKKKWGVSVGALAHRLSELQLVSKWHYRMLCIEMQKRGWRTEEPDGAARERSQVWEKVFSMLRDDKVGRMELAEALAVPEKEISDLVFGLVTISVPSPGEPSFRTPARGQLRVVK